MNQMFEHNSLLSRVLFHDKKVTKKHIRECNVDEILETVVIENISLKKASFIILALSKILSKKSKFLYDDCAQALQILCRERNTSSRSYRIPSAKPITLSLENENFFIGDEIYDLEADYAVTKTEADEILDNELITDHFDADFGEFPAVEQAREGTIVESSNIIPQESSFIVKRRKAIEDRMTEYAIDVFRANMRSSAGITNKLRRVNIENLMNFNLNIDKKLSNLFEKKEIALPDVEEERQGSVATDNFVADAFANDAADNMAYSVSNGLSESVETEKSSMFEIDTLPNKFEFNELTAGYSKSMKSLCFNSLLNLAADNKIRVSQLEPFGALNCLIKQES